MAVASLVLGLGSILFGVLFFITGWAAYIGLALGIIGIVLGAIKLKKSKMAVAGFICSLVGTVFNGILVFLILLAFNVLIGLLKSLGGK